MKRNSLLFSFFLFSLCCFGQNYLTIGQVFNYSVGDAFETDMGNTYVAGPPTYYFDSIIAKRYSSNKDTICYTEIQYSFTPPSCPTCTGSYSTISTVLDTVTNLDSIIGLTTMGNDCPTHDTVYSDSTHEYCGKKIYEMYPEQACLDTNIKFDWNNTTSWAIEGCGGVYFNNSTENGGDYFNLVFFRKHDTVCGSEVTGINTLVQQLPTISIYPNPASTKVTLAYSLPQGQHNAILKLYNAMGQLMKIITISNNAGQLTEDISDLSGGIYYYTVSTDGIIEATDKLVILK